MPEPFSGTGVSIAYSRAHPYLKNKRIDMYEDDLAECPLCRDVEPGRRTTLGRTLASEEGADVQTWAVEMRCGDCNRTYTVDERRTKLPAGSSAPTHGSTSEAGDQRTVDATQPPSVLADGKSEVAAANEHAESVPLRRAELDVVPPKQSANVAECAPPAQPQASWGIPCKFRYVSSPGNYQADTHTVSGKTPRGLEWTASASHCQDLEDNDRSWSLQLGNMCVAQSNDCGRDWASASTSVSHPKHGTISCADGRCRDPSQNVRETVTGSRSVAQLAIDEIAEHEGVSAIQVIAQLGYFSGIVRRFL